MQLKSVFSLLACLSIGLVQLAATPALAAAGSEAGAEPYMQCAQLVKDCWTSSGTERTRCLFTAAKHPFCEGTSLGKLTYKRWLMSPARPTGLESAPAFLGPTLVDQECLANFDNQWMGSLIDASSLESKLPALDKSLSSCTKEISHQLTRP